MPSGLKRACVSAAGVATIGSAKGSSSACGGSFELGARTFDTLSAAGILIEAGTFSGAGTLTDDTTPTGGTLHPGNSPGVLQIAGNYPQSGGVLQIDILGPGTPGVDYSQRTLRVTCFWAVPWNSIF